MIVGALVGAGSAGRCHINAVFGKSDAPIHYKWVWDLNSEAAQKTGASFGIDVAESLKQILEDKEVDFLDICTPTSTHKEYVEQATRAGKHVFCEKPIALTVPDGKAMIEACRSAGVKFGVGMVLRFFPEYVTMRDIIKSGEIGFVAVAHASRCGKMPKGAGDWYSRRELSGGVLVDLLIHDIDFCRWCFGEPETVYCTGVLDKEEVPDYALLLLRFESGTIAHLEGSWAEGEGFYTRFEAAGDSGLIEYDSRCVRSLRIEWRRRRPDERGVVIPESPGTNPYYLELSEFAMWVERDKPMRATPDDALAALRIALTAKRSFIQQKPLHLH